ncbi:hypothetical protein [Gimesia algae]|uniref:Uncharacterized protein n=1 Tax=Gimesia algae TaxID=2527971 RepID=A0A517V823_9PLAN|nr:hypothetical protein [Gimesia algae]QDT89158.1 hypothetical protein Pan161_07840 [Gimesia algae]
MRPADDEARQVPEGLLSEPLTLKALAQLFKTNRNKMKSMLTHMAGAEPFAGKWRVPLMKCPPQYFTDRNISTFNAIECHPLHRLSTEKQKNDEN